VSRASNRVRSKRYPKYQNMGDLASRTPDVLPRVPESAPGGDRCPGGGGLAPRLAPDRQFSPCWRATGRCGERRAEGSGAEGCRADEAGGGRREKEGGGAEEGSCVTGGTFLSSRGEPVGVRQVGEGRTVPGRGADVAGPWRKGLSADRTGARTVLGAVQGSGEVRRGVRGYVACCCPGIRCRVIPKVPGGSFPVASDAAAEGRPMAVPNAAESFRRTAATAVKRKGDASAGWRSIPGEVGLKGQFPGCLSLRSGPGSVFREPELVEHGPGDFPAPLPHSPLQLDSTVRRGRFSSAHFRD
jgi:hypothetical protein